MHDNMQVLLTQRYTQKQGAHRESEARGKCAAKGKASRSKYSRGPVYPVFLRANSSKLRCEKKKTARKKIQMRPLFLGKESEGWATWKTVALLVGKGRPPAGRRASRVRCSICPDHQTSAQFHVTSHRGAEPAMTADRRRKSHRTQCS